jgi:hypothetical protein
MPSIEIMNRTVCEALREQKRAHDAFVSILDDRINTLEKALESADYEGMMIHTFLINNHPDLIREYVEHCYSDCEWRPHAKRAVESFHDEELDLSTLECTGGEFKQWR